jgi:hypothetical protein
MASAVDRRGYQVEKERRTRSTAANIVVATRFAVLPVSAIRSTSLQLACQITPFLGLPLGLRLNSTPS